VLRVPVVRARSIALGNALAVAVAAAALAAVHAYRMREEGRAIGTLLGITRAQRVNGASLGTVNASPVSGAPHVARRATPDPQECPDPPSGAAPPAAGEKPREFVLRQESELRTLLADAAPAERVTRSVDAMFDYAELARRALGKPCPPGLPDCTNHWDTLTCGQRTEITELLRRIADRKVERHLREIVGSEVSYLQSSSVLGGGISRVDTQAKSRTRPQDPPVRVDFILMSAGNEHRIINVVTEGSSMTKNYYDQFHRMLGAPDQGYGYMVAKLEAKASRP